MPLYEYRCGQCEKQFEASQSVYARVEDTECPFCRAREATRLMSSFSSNVVGDRKPGFAELKAKAMNDERIRRFAKLPPLNIRPNMSRLDVTSESEPTSTEGSTS
ncbi:FmdB family zinc ribbon protein [Nitrospira sp. BLG_2]|uniref:FmdB family zinc ribbon protein n=1 Tax=Nitrospira sp. BLG_2 TaxID=3397507 RepID=UPI003B9C90AB